MYLRLAGEPPDPWAPSYRDLHPYATFRMAAGRPFSIAVLRGLDDVAHGRWEARRVARLIAATEAHRWSLHEAEAILRRAPEPEPVKEIALDLLIHGYLKTMVR